MTSSNRTFLEEYRKKFPAVARVVACAAETQVITAVEEDNLWLELLHFNIDLNHAEAVIDGSWPNADDYIKGVREARAAREKTQDG